MHSESHYTAKKNENQQQEPTKSRTEIQELYAIGLENSQKTYKI